MSDKRSELNYDIGGSMADDLLIFTQTDSGEIVHAMYLPSGSRCEGCNAELTAQNAMETEDEVMLCRDCYEACAE